jgi:drug/metabolite transporter (DMT)-like permease
VLPWWTFPFGALGERVDLGAATGGTLTADLSLWLLVAWVVLLGTVAPFGLVLLGLDLIGATRTGLIGTAEPALAGLVAWVVLGEVLTDVQILGGAIVLAGIVLAETARTPRAQAAGTLPEGVAPS